MATGLFAPWRRVQRSPGLLLSVAARVIAAYGSVRQYVLHNIA